MLAIIYDYRRQPELHFPTPQISEELVATPLNNKLVTQPSCHKQKNAYHVILIVTSKREFHAIANNNCACK